MVLNLSASKIDIYELWNTLNFDCLQKKNTIAKSLMQIKKRYKCIYV